MLKCWPDQTVGSLDPHLFRDREAFTALNCPEAFLMSLRLIGGWKFVERYQTYSQTCVAAVCIWVHTPGRFKTFDGLSGAVSFLRAGVLRFSLLLLRRSASYDIDFQGGQILSVSPKGTMPCIYIYRHTHIYIYQDPYICMRIGDLVVV